MQCIYILDTLYLFKVTYVIYLDTIVCHLRNAFFLSSFFKIFYLLIQMVPNAVYIYYNFTIYSKQWETQYDFFLNKHKLGCDAVTYGKVKIKGELH